MEINTGQQLNSSALKWLYEMEALDSPILLQNLYENVFLADKRIKDCKIFITPPQTQQKGILVWLKLGFWAKTFHKDQIYLIVEQVIETLLPSYRVRIVDNENILFLAVKRLKELYGDTHATNNNNDNKPTQYNGKSAKSTSIPKASHIQPNSKKSSKDK